MFQRTDGSAATRRGYRAAAGGLLLAGLTLAVGFPVAAQEPTSQEPTPQEPVADEATTVEGSGPRAIGEATIDRARADVRLFQTRQTDELLVRHTEKARRLLPTAEQLAERAYKDRDPCVEVELISERFDCYPEPQAESLDPFCVYNRRVLCEGRDETTLFYVSLEPGSGIVQRIQRIDTKPPSAWTRLLGQGCAFFIVAAVSVGFVGGIIGFVILYIRRIRKLGVAYLTLAKGALASSSSIDPKRPSHVEGRYKGRKAVAGVERRRHVYYHDGQRRYYNTFHAWLRIHHDRPLDLGLRVTPREQLNWLGRLLSRVFKRNLGAQLGDPRFDELYKLHATELERARELLATPVAGASVARQLLHWSEADWKLTDSGVAVATRLAEADAEWLAEALAQVEQLVETIAGARRD